MKNKVVSTEFYKLIPEVVPNFFGEQDTDYVALINRIDTRIKQIQNIVNDPNKTELERSNEISYSSLYALLDSLEFCSKNFKSINTAAEFTKQFLKNLKAKIADLIYLIPGLNNKPVISLIGNAGIISSKSSNSETSGNGSLGFRFLNKDKNFEGKALLTLFSSTDTIVSKYSNDSTMTITNRADFGNSILVPKSGESIQTGYIELRKMIPQLEPFISGIEFNSSLTTRIWSDTNSTVSNHKINVFSFSVGPIMSIFSTPIQEKHKIALNLKALFTTRIIAGDVRGDENFRNRVLGSTETFFAGIDLGFTIKYKDINGFISFPILFNPPIEGLTSGQFVGGFNFETSIFDF